MAISHWEESQTKAFYLGLLRCKGDDFFIKFGERFMGAIEERCEYHRNSGTFAKSVGAPREDFIYEYSLGEIYFKGLSESEQKAALREANWYVIRLRKQWKRGATWGAPIGFSIALILMSFIR
tara:strand:- start:213 stop:581 length:369 start_codon:yes stop_codon:yes gene_type:complete